MIVAGNNEVEYKVMTIMYASIILMIVSLRIWWIWWCKANDSIAMLGIRMRVSTMMHGFTLVCTLLATAMIKTSAIKDSLFIDISYIIPFLTTSVVINVINVIKMLRLWYVWYKLDKVLEHRRRIDENIFGSVVRSREGYRETRQELESAGIEPAELDQLQQMEWRNTRRLLSRFGNRALQNINLLRIILNIDGDRDPEDTDENRVSLCFWFLYAFWFAYEHSCCYRKSPG